MDNKILSLLKLSILFAKNLVGCVNTPYVTYRKLAQENTNSYQSVFLFLLVIAYFLFVSLMKTGIRSPLLLTVKFNSLLFSAAVGFMGMVLMLSVLGYLVGGRGKLRSIILLWAFSLIPTLIWFFATSLLYLILPPPRTLSFLGKFYSVTFVTFSLSVFIWKGILYYLTLRFALKLDLLRILLVTIILLPILAIFSVGTYRLGIFRIPFI